MWITLPIIQLQRITSKLNPTFNWAPRHEGIQGRVASLILILACKGRWWWALGAGRFILGKTALRTHWIGGMVSARPGLNAVTNRMSVSSVNGIPGIQPSRMYLVRTHRSTKILLPVGRSGKLLLVLLSLYFHADLPTCFGQVRGPSTPHDPESDDGGSLSSWQGHPSR
jgi:hypothetical protein